MSTIILTAFPLRCKVWFYSTFVSRLTIPKLSDNASNKLELYVYVKIHTRFKSYSKNVCTYERRLWKKCLNVSKVWKLDFLIFGDFLGDFFPFQFHAVNTAWPKKGVFGIGVRTYFNELITCLLSPCVLCICFCVLNVQFSAVTTCCTKIYTSRPNALD